MGEIMDDLNSGQEVVLTPKKCCTCGSSVLGSVAGDFCPNLDCPAMYDFEELIES